jgi:hypothetical protein
MDLARLLERFDSKKTRPITTIVIAEVMLFLFSIETLIVWFNIHPKMFLLFFVSACLAVFTILQFIKQPQGNRSWVKSFIQWRVLISTIFSIFLFLLLFIFYVIFVVPNYRVISITKFEKNQFNNIEKGKYSKKETLKELSSEIQLIIGEQYSVNIDDNVKQGFENSRLIIVPGIFQNEKALETIIKLEDGIKFFIESKEEKEIPNLAVLWKNLGCKSSFPKIKKQIGFMRDNAIANENNWFNEQWNKFKYILNF